MSNLDETRYLELLKTVKEHGIIRETRNGKTYSDFGHLLKFDIKNNGFPLLTTKKIFVKVLLRNYYGF